MTATQRWTTAVAWTMIATAGADNLGVNTALHSIQATGVASAPTLLWALLVHLLALVAALSAGDRIGARVGNRRALIAGSALYAASSAACALATHGIVLVTARAGQGAGSGLAVGAALGLMNLAFPADSRGTAAHRVAPGFALALVAGPLVDGAVAAGPGWRWIFAADAAIGACAAALACRAIRPDRGRGGQLDPEGTLAALVAAGAPVWALIRAERVGWAAPEVLALVAAGAVALAAVLWWDTPSGPLHRWRFLAANASDLFLFASVYGTGFLVAAELRGDGGRGGQGGQAGLAGLAGQAGYGGHGPLGIGLRLMPWTVLMAGAMIWPARGRFRREWVSAAGSTLHAVGLVWLAFLAPSGRLSGTAAIPLALSGIGAGLALSRARIAGLGRTRREQPGRAAALLGALPMAGAAVGIALIAVAAHASRTGVPGPDRAARTALCWAAGLALAAAAAILAVPRERDPARGLPGVPGQSGRSGQSGQSGQPGQPGHSWQPGRRGGAWSALKPIAAPGSPKWGPVRGVQETIWRTQVRLAELGWLLTARSGGCGGRPAASRRRCAAPR
ncbi:MFS family permease [Catenulispora sp. GP43]|uniref:MFS transporter n=1 Tax=Catenulispora sp. GP43 TaxID=3156263 RepID=UPI003515ED9C